MKIKTWLSKIESIIYNNTSVLFIGFIILVLLVPRYMNHVSIFGYVPKSLNSESTSIVINNLTAPIIGLFSALLVYLAFRSQVDANNKQYNFNIKQSNFNDLSIYLELEKSIIQELAQLSYNRYEYKLQRNKWETYSLSGQHAIKSINNRLLETAILKEYSFENLLNNRELRESELILFFQNTYALYMKLDSIIDFFKTCNFDQKLKEVLIRNLKSHFDLNNIENIEVYNPNFTDKSYKDITNELILLIPKIKEINSKIKNLKS